MDLLSHNETIRKVLNRLKIQGADRDDMKQECYIVLFESQELLDKGAADGGSITNLVYTICHNRICEILRNEKGTRRTLEINKSLMRTDSLSDPQVWRKACKVLSLPKLGVTGEKLREAIIELPKDEQEVVYLLFLEGQTQEETAAILGINRNSVQARSKRAIVKLKQYFGVN